MGTRLIASRGGRTVQLKGYSPSREVSPIVGLRCSRRPEPLTGLAGWPIGSLADGTRQAEIGLGVTAQDVGARPSRRRSVYCLRWLRDCP